MADPLPRTGVVETKGAPPKIITAPLYPTGGAV